MLERVGRLGGSGGLGRGLGACPVADPAEHRPLYLALAKAISGKIVRSCHDLSDGGLAVALAESCLGGRMGAAVSLDAMPGRAASGKAAADGAGAASGPAFSEAGPRYPEAAALLFSEDPGRFLVSIRGEDRERFERSLAGLRFAMIGETRAEPRLLASLRGAAVADAALDDIERAFKTPIA